MLHERANRAETDVVLRNCQLVQTNARSEGLTLSHHRRTQGTTATDHPQLTSKDNCLVSDTSPSPAPVCSSAGDSKGTNFQGSAKAHQNHPKTERLVQAASQSSIPTLNPQICRDDETELFRFAEGGPVVDIPIKANILRLNFAT
jgi:hypothetical protein